MVSGDTSDRCNDLSITFEMSSCPLPVLLGRLCMRVVISKLLVGFKYIVAGLSGMLLMLLLYFVGICFTNSGKVFGKFIGYFFSIVHFYLVNF